MVSFRTFLAALCLVLASFTQLHADEKTEHIRLYPRDGPEIRAPSMWDEGLLQTPPHTPLAELFSDKPYAPGQRIIEYEGLQGAIVSRVLSYHHRYYFAAVNEGLVHGYLSLGDVDRISYAYTCGEHDAKYGRWWDRNFFESMVPEKGGAPEPEVCHIGRELTIFEIGGVALTNKGKLNFGKTEFYIQKAEIDTGSVKSVVTGIVRRERFKISNYLDVSFRPRVNIRASLRPEDILSSLELDMNINVFYNPKKPPIAQASISAEFEPFNNERASLKVGIAVLIW